MKIHHILLLSLSLIASTLTFAGSNNMVLDAAVGGGLGGAAGGAIGAQVGGKQGAIIGAAAGAAVGAAILTDNTNKQPVYWHDKSYNSLFNNGHPHYRHCPPGQAKKGRC